MRVLLFILWVYWPHGWYAGHAEMTPGWSSQWVADDEEMCREVMRSALPLLRRDPGAAMACLPAGYEPVGKISEPVNHER